LDSRIFKFKKRSSYFKKKRTFVLDLKSDFPHSSAFSDQQTIKTAITSQIKSTSVKHLSSDNSNKRELLFIISTSQHLILLSLSTGYMRSHIAMLA